MRKFSRCTCWLDVNFTFPTSFRVREGANERTCTLAYYESRISTHYTVLCALAYVSVCLFVMQLDHTNTNMTYHMALHCFDSKAM